MTNIDWMVGYTILGLIGLLGLLGLFCWLWQEKILKCHAKQIRCTFLFKQWGGYSPYKWKDCCSPNVYYLDIVGNLRKMDFDDFYKLKLPEEDQPKVWIISASRSGVNQTSASNMCLVWDQEAPSLRHWRICAARVESVEEFSFFHFCSLRKYSESVEIKALDGLDKDELFRKILRFVQDYENRDKAFLKELQRIAPPILLASKDSMGGSPAIESVRIMIEGGPEEFFKEPVPDSLFE